MTLYDSAGGVPTLANCARACLELGRLAEAEAWCRLILESQPRNADALDILRQLAEEPGEELPWLRPEDNLAERISYAHLPLPEYAPRSPGSPGPEAFADRSADIRFAEEAAERGLGFTYFNGQQPDQEGRKMYEYTGGGVGVLDYDRDGWPDLYFTQGSSWPPDPLQTSQVDHLYRNRQGERFTEVAGPAGLMEGRFGQGISVGDFDGDGFSDLYVANLNGNRLFRNNGDGTFEDVTATAGVGHDFWTTSCLLADLNGDGLPDIYDVTFLQGDNVFTIVCRDKDGVARSCAPKGFEAAPDFVYFNQGDGTFAPAAPNAGFDVPNGDGLGIVAADFDQSGRLGLFIANDGRPNFYLTPVPPVDGPITSWEERGLLSGLAYDDVGASQACMGVAAEDANHDGRIDLFVTNFYEESNTLYVNMGTETFLDQTESFGLREPSLKLLGFGTQFLDADLDGWSDLVLVNGHVDDFSHKGIPYRMRPQFFRNQRGTRFEELTAPEVGPWFGIEQLGRGLATVDWNRDLRPDFVVNNLDHPASLVTNTTSDAGQAFSLRLVGRSGARDAIGTRVVVHAGDLEYERQLTAGDGYQASKEKLLVFGLGPEPVAGRVTIIWPGGQEQTFADVAAGREYVAVEGTQQLWTLTQSDP